MKLDLFKFPFTGIAAAEGAWRECVGTCHREWRAAESIAAGPCALSRLVLEMFAFNVLSSHLEWTNQEAFQGSKDTAEVEVPQAGIVLIGFGGGAFSKVHVHYCVWFWKHLLSMYSIVFTSGMDQSVSQDIAEVEVPQACIALIGFGGGAFCCSILCKIMKVDEHECLTSCF